MIEGVNSVDGLISKVFDVENLNAAILAPTNRSVDFINDLVLDRLLQEEQVCFPSHNYVAEDTHNTSYPVEVLNQVQCSGQITCRA
jgi:hypothetical protein